MASWTAAELEKQFQKEEEWDGRSGPAAVAAVLTTWLELMDGLSDWAGNAKPPKFAEYYFVSGLAGFWTEELEAELMDSRRPTSADQSDRQKGPFAEFVRAAAEIIPPEFKKGLKSWEWTIKEVTGSFLGRE